MARILTQVVDGEKRTHYRCSVCLEQEDEDASPRLERPCDRCGKQEGRIKLTRLKDRYRVIEYLCDGCATKR